VPAFEGNRAETKTMLPVIEAFMAAHQLPDVTIVADAGMISEANQKAIEAAGLSFIFGMKIPHIPYAVAQWRREHPDEPIPDGHIFTQPWPAGPDGGRRDQVIYYQYKADRARRTLRGIDEQVKKAEQAVSGKAPVKRNRFIQLSGGTRAVNRELEAKARALAYWLAEVIEPGLAPKTYERYEMITRLYIVPSLGAKRLDRLQVRDVRGWLNQLRQACQCWQQGKDAARPGDEQRCCAVGKCCSQRLSERTIKNIRDTLRAALGNAVAEELITRNVASVVRLPVPRKPRRSPWSVDEARAFLESARSGRDPLYAAYVLVLVLGLRRGEALGLTWADISLTNAEVSINWQLQRSRGQLHHRETKTRDRLRCFPCRRSVPPPSSCVPNSRTATALLPGRLGRILPWCSPRPAARLTSRATSPATSRSAAPRRECATSGSMTPGGPARLSWWP